MEEIIITKRISKMGDNNILIIPKDLKEHISANDLVEVKIKIISKAENNKVSHVKKSKESIKKANTLEAKNKKKHDIDDKILHIVSGLKSKGYNEKNIMKVMKSNGYDLEKVKLALDSLKYSKK